MNTNFKLSIQLLSVFIFLSLLLSTPSCLKKEETNATTQDTVKKEKSKEPENKETPDEKEDQSSTNAIEAGNIENTQSTNGFDPLRGYPFKGENLKEINQELKERFPSIVDGLDAGSINYDITLWPFAAALESINYSRGDSWEEISLELSEEDEENRYYLKAVKAHYKPSAAGNKNLFIIFGSTYSTWARSTWINKIARILIDKFSDPQIIYFPGFYSQEMLKFEPIVPELNGSLIANDLYGRLRNRMNSTDESSKPENVGLIGLSGAGNIVISMLAEDSAYSENRNLSPLFNRGAMVFNPALDLKASFDNLDAKVDSIVESGHPEQKGLTTPDTFLEAILNPNSLMGQIINEEKKRILGENVKGEAYKKILAATATDEKTQKEALMTEDLFYNEFICTDLMQTTKASHSPDFDWLWGAEKVTDDQLPINQGDRHRHYFERYTFERHKELFPEYAEMDFSTYTSLLPFLEEVKAPLYIVFPLDDPILSIHNINNPDQLTEEAKRVIEYCRASENIDIFTPDYGSHLAYFLDTDWITNLIVSFFKADQLDK